MDLLKIKRRKRTCLQMTIKYYSDVKKAKMLKLKGADSSACFFCPRVAKDSVFAGLNFYVQLLKLLLTLLLVSCCLFRHRVLKVPLPSVCEVQPLSPLLHGGGSTSIYLQLLERWDSRNNLLIQLPHERCDLWFLLLTLPDPHHRDMYVNNSDYLALLNGERPSPNSTGQQIP